MTDTSVKIFSSAQIGAPTLNNTAGSLIALLDACLVNGFGLKTCDSVVIAAGVGTATISTGHGAIPDGVVLFSGATGSFSALNGERKVTSAGINTVVFDATGLADGTATGTITLKLAPAGWIKSFSGTNLGAYKSGNAAATGTYLRVDDTTAAYAVVRGYVTMTDINTGLDPFPTSAQQSTSNWYKSNTTVTRNWWLIGNDRMFYLGIASNSSYSPIMAIYAFGDLISRKAGDAYRAVLYAQSDLSPPIDFNYNPVGCGYPGFYHVKYLPRSYSALGSPVAVTQTWFNDNTNASASSGAGGRSFPNPSDNGIVFTPMQVMEGAGYRGELPGVAAAPQSIGAGIVDDARIANTPGFARTLVYKTFLVNSTPTYGGVFFDLTGPWGV